MEAQRLVDVFHKYLGMPRAGEADFVRAEPAGRDLQAVDRPQSACAAVRAFGRQASIRPRSRSSSRPLPDGTWQVSDMLMPSPLTMHTREATTTTRSDGLHFDGIYDPALAGVRPASTRRSRRPTARQAGPNAEGASHSGEQTVQGTASAADDGAVNVAMQQTLREHRDAPVDHAARIRTRHRRCRRSSICHTASIPAPRAGRRRAGRIEAARSLGLRRRACAGETRRRWRTQEIKKRLTDLLPIYQHIEEKTRPQGVPRGNAVRHVRREDLSGGGCASPASCRAAQCSSHEALRAELSQEESLHRGRNNSCRASSSSPSIFPASTSTPRPGSSSSNSTSTASR